MKSNQLIALLILLGLLPLGVNGLPSDYSTQVTPTLLENVMITWNTIESPDLSVEWGWTGQGSWFIEEGEQVSLTIESIREDVEGVLSIGNFTIFTSNTDIARELVFGVWGLTPFFPGFVVPIGAENLEVLNETAYASAARVKNNYLNGTMVSQYKQLTIGGESYECITFDYIQDPSDFGEPQETHLAYDTATGVLVSGNTSVTIENPYHLHIEVSSVTRVPNALAVLAFVASASALVFIIVVILLRRR